MNSGAAQEEFSLIEVLRFLIRRKLLIGTITVLAIAGAYSYTTFIQRPVTTVFAIIEPPRVESKNIDRTFLAPSSIQRILQSSQVVDKSFSGKAISGFGARVLADVAPPQIELTVRADDAPRATEAVKNWVSALNERLKELNKEFLQSRVQSLQGEVGFLRKQVANIEQALQKMTDEGNATRQNLTANARKRTADIVQKFKTAENERERAERDAELRVSELLLQSELSSVSEVARVRSAGFEEALKTKGDELADATGRLAAYESDLSLTNEAFVLSISTSATVAISPTKAILAAAILGFLAGIGIAVLAELIPQALKDRSSAEM